VGELPFPSIGDALEWLDGHINFEASVPNRRALPTLEPMRELAGLLGDPQRSIPTIHLTGTNGKGSTAAMVTMLLVAQGLRAGTYASPNLSAVNERLAIDGVPIDDDALRELLSSLAALEPLLGTRPTRFELLTAAALRWFADEAVDAMVVEVGLGGTWDSTNVVDGSVAVVTNVSYDHTEVLGPTLEGIARDKSGIITPGCTVVVGETAPDLAGIFAETAREVGAAAVWQRGRDFDCTVNLLSVGGRQVELRTPGGRYPDLFVPLNGPHQGENAACALAAAEAFFGRPLDPEVAAAGFAAVRVPGRLEVLGRHPLRLVDGAHNVAGMAALGRALTEGFAVAGETVAVIGMLSGRDPSAMLAPLREAGIGTVVACAPDWPRALSADVVAEAARALGFAVVVAPSVPDALVTALALVPDDGALVVAGSLYVVADARVALSQGAGRA
jgi:dihydrofolate synthase/folylpolyglutamate synthase